MALSSLRRTLLVQGVLCDINGVLAVSSANGEGGTLIPGSIEAVDRLGRAGIKIKFLTNETLWTGDCLHGKLKKAGFSINREDILCPAVAMSHIIKKQGLRPFFLVPSSGLEEFEQNYNEKEANCVVIGDARDVFNYDNLNAAFRVLDRSPQHQLYSLGKGKYYKEDGWRQLDVGAFAAALEFSTDRSAIVVGKPGLEFFQSGLSALGLPKDQVFMVGDDLESDVGGAQMSGIRGALVRTGKYKSDDEHHPVVKADLVVDNLKGFVDLILDQ